MFVRLLGAAWALGVPPFFADPFSHLPASYWWGNTYDSHITIRETLERETLEHLTKETFRSKIFDYENNTEWKYKGDLPAIIDFYADWCAPCRMVAPILEQLAKEYAGKINIYKVDTDKEQELAMVFGIRSIPSILFIPKNGKPQMAMGAMPREAFIEAINTVLMPVEVSKN